MTISRLVFSSLAASFLLNFVYISNTNAQSSSSWLEQAVGLYQSQIWSAGSLVSGTTEFRQTSDGSLSGSYTMNEQGESVPGTLSQCQAVQMLVMRCVWKDKYGTGNLDITFSENFSSFDGYWGEGDLKTAFPWNGSR